MKPHLLLTLVCSLSVLGPMQAYAQEKTPTNRYSMKLEKKADGSYGLLKEKNYVKAGVDLASIPDLLVPYTHENDRLTGKLYNKVVTDEYVYKTCDSYELHIAVDRAMNTEKAPVMFFLHGGGWSRGSFDSSRSLSKYLAQQKGITGVRIQYTLAPQPGANVQVSIQDVMDAVQYVLDRAESLGIDPERVGFLGTSAGGHLAAVAALRHPGTKVFVGYSGIYDLTTAKITTRTKDQERIAYFGGLDGNYLKEASPYFMIPKKLKLAAQLYCGTADITVECSQSEEFARELKKHKAKVDLQVYKNYDHNLSSKSSDKMEEIFFKTVDFVAENI